MKNQIFKNAEFGQIRTCMVNGETYFVGKDVASALGYINPNKAMIDHVDNEDKLTSRIVMAGQNRQVVVINESRLYALILSSKLESARRFKMFMELDKTARLIAAMASVECGIPLAQVNMNEVWQGYDLAFPNSKRKQVLREEQEALKAQDEYRDWSPYPYWAE